MTPLDKIIAVRDAQGLSITQKFILMIIASHLGNNDYAFLSLSTLQKECEIKSRHNVTDNLKILVEIGYLESIPPSEGYRSNRYKVNFDQFRKGTSTVEELVPQRNQGSTVKEPQQFRKGTRLVPQRNPKRKLKEIKRKLKRTQAEILSHENPSHETWEIPVKPINHKAHWEAECEESEIGDISFIDIIGAKLT